MTAATNSNSKSSRRDAIRFIAVAFALALMQIGAPSIALADGSMGLTVTPVVIDEKGKIRDILNETLTLTNTGVGTLTLFPSINDVNDANGQQPFAYAQNASGLTASLSNWTELSRGVIDLAPGETKTVPFVITISPNAIPNTYHANITFTQGTTREEADANPPLATVEVNLEVDADIHEAMQLVKFSSDNVVFTGDDVLFNYALQNIGNQNLAPTGQIDIYDRNGEEVASVDVNKEGNSISPDQTAQLASVWSGASGFGKFKALLTVNYGSQQASVQDTVFFWVIPWKQLLIGFFVTMVAVVILGLYFNRWMETRHLGKLAAAGALRPEVLEQMRNSAPPPIISMPSLPPMPAMPTLPPASEIVERVQSQVREKRTIFTMFKRQGFVSMPEPLAKSIVAHAPAQESAAPSAQGGTIDLKNMRKNAAPADGATNEQHIINLKNPRS